MGLVKERVGRVLLAGRERGEHMMLGNNGPRFGVAGALCGRLGSKGVLLKKQPGTRAERAVWGLPGFIQQ